MRLSSSVALLLVLSATFTCTPRATAGPLAPCVTAVSSRNDNYLVVTDIQLEPGTGIVPGRPLNVRQVTLRVLRKETFANEKDRLVAPATFWTSAQWSVILNSQNTPRFSGCPLSLISEDGEFLVVFDVNPESRLRIYRRRDHPGEPVMKGPDQGVFIRDIPLQELWPADKVAGPQTGTDESPQWFAGGTFEFSQDCRQLIHRTRWGSTVRINLADGFVARE